MLRHFQEKSEIFWQPCLKIGFIWMCLLFCEWNENEYASGKQWPNWNYYSWWQVDIQWWNISVIKFSICIDRRRAAHSHAEQKRQWVASCMCVFPLYLGNSPNFNDFPKNKKDKILCQVQFENRLLRRNAVEMPQKLGIFLWKRWTN